MQIVVIGNLAILLSMPFLFYSNNLNESLLYLAQLCFIITILPLFFESIISQNLIHFFAKSYLFFFTVISIGFLFFGILHFYAGYDNLGIYHLAGLHRISYGDTLVSNDLGMFLATGFFLTWILIQNKFTRILLLIIFSLTYLLTLSKSILLVLVLFWLYFSRRYLLRFVLVTSVLLYLISPFMTEIQRIDRLIQIGEGGGGRMIKVAEIIEQPEVFLVPLHGQADNKVVSFKYGGQSVHNFFLSILVNLGLIQAALVLIPLFVLLLILFIKRDKSFILKITLLTLFLQIAILSLNALMLTRVIWIAIFLVVFYSRFIQQQWKFNE